MQLVSSIPGGEKGPRCRSLTSAGCTSETTKPGNIFAPCPPRKTQHRSAPIHQPRELPPPQVAFPASPPARSLTLGKSPPSLPVLLCTDHNISLSYSAEGGED